MITAPHQLEQQLASVVAERNELHDALEQLVRFVDKHGGYMTPEHQRSLRNAKALLVEVKRTPKEST